MEKIPLEALLEANTETCGLDHVETQDNRPITLNESNRNFTDTKSRALNTTIDNVSKSDTGHENNISTETKSSHINEDNAPEMSAEEPTANHIPQSMSESINPSQLFSPTENLSELVLDVERNISITENTNDLLKKQPINFIVRSKIFIETMVFNKYYYIHTDGSKLLYAKRSLNGFNIYNSKDDSYIGKMRTNIFGTKYTFGNLLEAKYETSFLDKGKPRALKVKLDGLDLINKKPYFNTETNSFSLNFSGRVTRPSVKIFQIVHPLEPTYITLTFGKEEVDSYILDYSHPWSMLSAFCVGLSALDHKFGCD